MTAFEGLFPKDLYHSYIVEGDPSDTVRALYEFLVSRGDIASESPDVLLETHDAFSMEKSGILRLWQSEKGITDGKKIAIIGAKFINIDAGQTLLKIIEEPKEGTHFFIVVPHRGLLLDTILSRSHIVRIENLSKERNNSGEIFIQSAAKDRIELVKNLIEESADDEGSGALRFRATELINAIEKLIYQKWTKEKKDTHLAWMLEELSKAREFLSTPGCSVKMILEHIALVL